MMSSVTISRSGSGWRRRGSADGLGVALNALFQAGFDKAIKVAVHHALDVAHFHVGAQILDAGLVKTHSCGSGGPSRRRSWLSSSLLGSGCACASPASYRRDFSIAIASARFDAASGRSGTAHNIGRLWVMRTAESVLLMC